jgi:hypothetical protein
LPPQIISDDFSKPLGSQIIDFDYNNPINTTHFFNEVDLSIYKLVELKNNEGSDFSGCIELFKYEFNDLADEVILARRDDLKIDDLDAFEMADALLELTFSPEKITRIARYVYKDKKVNYENEEILGKQIKGAHVADDHTLVRLTTVVYKYLRDKYNLLICDNTQTADGHKLWAFGVCKWADVDVYDCHKDMIVAKLPQAGNLPDNNIVPWSISVPFLPIDTIDSLRQGFWTSHVDLHHIVLLIRNR